MSELHKEVHVFRLAYIHDFAYETLSHGTPRDKPEAVLLRRSSRRENILTTLSI